MQRLSAVALTNLSTDPIATVAISDSDGLPPLIKMLSSPDPKVQRQAARALSNLALNDQNMHMIVELDALRPLIEMVGGTSPDAQREAARALCNLARDDKNADLMVKRGALVPFINMLGDRDVDAQGLAVVAMVNLSMNDANCKAIADAGAAIPLEALSECPVEKVSKLASETLQNIRPFLNLNQSVDGKPAAAEGVPPGGAAGVRPDAKGKVYLPDIIIAAGSEDKEEARKAVQMLTQAAKQDPIKVKIVDEGGLIPLMIMMEDPDPAAQQCAARPMLSGEASSQRHRGARSVHHSISD